MTDSPSVRLFTALWPDPVVRTQLAALRDAWHWPPGAKPVVDANLHATLHFIGAFPRARLPALAAALDAVTTPPPLRLRLAGGEVWPGGIAVATLDEPPALLDLHARLADALAGLDVPLDLRPYRPHVTLARKAAGAVKPPAVPALEWVAEGFALVVSRGGSYAVLETWGAPA